MYLTNTMYFYIPVLIAIYIMATNFKQISPLWVIFLALSIFTGAGPIIAILFLITNRKLFEAPTQPAAQTTFNPTGPNQESALGTPALNSTPSSPFQITSKKAGFTLGGVVAAILWSFGLIAVGFFIFITIVAIQCINDPKCI